MAKRNGSPKISVTKNYRLFVRSDDNRPSDLKKHRKLIESMKMYGFLSCFPIVCTRDSKGNLVVKDGQHRLMIAETLGLSVYYVEESVDFDVARVNCTAKIWQLRDYAQKHATNGIEAYREGLEFADQHALPIGTAFALLAGYVSFSSVNDAFATGSFEIRDRKWADMVAGIYNPLRRMNPKIHNARFLEACMAVCRVDGFDTQRLISNAEKCREKLIPYSTRHAYLDMLEEIYNFYRSKLVGLKAEALMAMRERNATARHSLGNGASK